MEKINTNWLRTICILGGLFFIRVCAENSFFSIKIDRFVLSHEISFFFWGFLLILSLFCLLLKEELKKLFSSASLIISLVIIAPFLDKFLFLRTNAYDYTRPQDFWLNLKTFFWHSPSVGKGLIIELGLIVLLITAYVLFKTKSWWKGLIAAAISYLGVQLIAAPGIYLDLPDYVGVAQFLPVVIHAERLLYFLFYLFTSLLLAIFIFYIKKRALAIALIKNIRPLRTASFLVLATAGIVLSGKMSFDFPERIFALSVLFSVFFLWQSAVIINDVYDVETDKLNRKPRPLVDNVISSREYLKLGILLGLTGVSISFLLGPVSFLCGLSFFLLGLLYSVPPFRLRKNLWSYPVIGLGQALAFMLGFSSGELSFEIANMNSGLKLSLYIFSVITCGSIVKDAEDFEGDSTVNIKNFFVLLGKERARLYASMLLFLGFLSPLLFIHDLLDFIFYVPLAFIVALSYYKKNSYKFVILMYIIAAVFFVVRFV